jgi:GxxExxY protein
MLEMETVTESIIGAAILVHREIGPGFLESTYEACLARELLLRGHGVARQVPVSMVYRGEVLDCGYRLDLLVDDAVVVEVKAVDRIIPVHEAQLLSYLKFSGKRVGLLINFNVRCLKHGLMRRVL